MKSFSDLSFYVVTGGLSRKSLKAQPSLQLQSQVILWAGQVYLESMAMYRETERLLGIRRSVVGGSTQVDCDGEILEYFKDMISARRKGMHYGNSHLWKILHLRPLVDEDFTAARQGVKPVQEVEKP